MKTPGLPVALLSGPPMAYQRFFSTSGIAARDAYEAWRSREWPSLAPVFDTQPSEGAFFANSETFLQSELYADANDSDSSIGVIRKIGLSQIVAIEGRECFNEPDL